MLDKSNDELIQYLEASFEDLLLSQKEKYDLIALSKHCTDDQIRFMRNRAFDLYRDFALNNVGDAEKIASRFGGWKKRLKHYLLKVTAIARQAPTFPLVKIVKKI